MTQSVKRSFGLRLPAFVRADRTDGLEATIRYVQRAEKLGFEHAFIIDHFVITPPAYACTWLEPMTFLTAVASRTKKMRVGPLVLVLPIRNPMYLAKQVATLDFLSEGRFVMGVGVGWNKEEFDLMQIPWTERGKRTTECLEILKELWMRNNVTYQGKYYHFANLSIEPKPTQKPHPPIWIGGGSQPFELIYGQKTPDLTPVLRRIARFANVWVPHSSVTAEGARQDWEQICKYAQESGRDAARDIRIAYSNFVYVLKKGQNPAVAAPYFSRFSGMNLEYWQKHYLLGTAEQIVEHIRARIAAVGDMDHIILNPLSYDIERLEELWSEVLTKL